MKSRLIKLESELRRLSSENIILKNQIENHSRNQGGSLLETQHNILNSGYNQNPLGTHSSSFHHIKEFGTNSPSQRPNHSQILAPMNQREIIALKNQRDFSPSKNQREIIAQRNKRELSDYNEREFESHLRNEREFSQGRDSTKMRNISQFQRESDQLRDQRETLGGGNQFGRDMGYGRNLKEFEGGEEYYDKKEQYSPKYYQHFSFK